MSVIQSYRKAAVERRRLVLDYGRWLEDTEELIDFQVTVSPLTEDAPILVNVAYPDVAHRMLVMFVSGGVSNTNYTLSLIVRTDEGQIKRDDIGLRVAP